MTSRGAQVDQCLIEHHRVHGDARVVLGDDFLTRDVQHLLHHVYAPSDALDERLDEVKTGRQGALKAPRRSSVYA